MQRIYVFTYLLLKSQIPNPKSQIQFILLHITSGTTTDARPSERISIHHIPLLEVSRGLGTDLLSVGHLLKLFLLLGRELGVEEDEDADAENEEDDEAGEGLPVASSRGAASGWLDGWLGRWLGRCEREGQGDAGRSLSVDYDDQRGGHKVRGTPHRTETHLTIVMTSGPSQAVPLSVTS